jgi:hypothetical protein
MLSLDDFTSLDLTHKIGAAFIGGGATGFAMGTIVGLSRNLNELPLIRLNGVLNSAAHHGSVFAYHCGMTATLIAGAHSLAQAAGAPPVAQYAAAGGAAGTFFGSRWGVKSAIKGGIAGAAIGAAVGLAREHYIEPGAV